MKRAWMVELEIERLPRLSEVALCMGIALGIIVGMVGVFLLLLRVLP